MIWALFGRRSFRQKLPCGSHVRDNHVTSSENLKLQISSDKSAVFCLTILRTQ